MGKTYLSGKELQQFPTIGSLSSLCGGHDPEKWGLCQRGAEVAFGEANESFVLQVSLNWMYEMAHLLYGGEYNPDRMILFYAIEVGVNNIECSLYELTPDDPIIQMVPFIPPKEVIHN